jgi:DNA-3-methyladenine glycosylase I
MDKKHRCGWCTGTEIERRYHDEEWGVPLHDDRKLFEFLLLDGAQAGLSWLTILNKREGYRAAFDNFDPYKIAEYGEGKVAELLNNPAIVRNRLKVASAIRNARGFLEVQAEFSSFDRFIWQFTDGETIQNSWRLMQDIPARTAEAEAMSKELKRRNFNFVGPTICYAFMQAAGMVNDHVIDCFRYEQVQVLA